MSFLPISKKISINILQKGLRKMQLSFSGSIGVLNEHMKRDTDPVTAGKFKY